MFEPLLLNLMVIKATLIFDGSMWVALSDGTDCIEGEELLLFHQ